MPPPRHLLLPTRRLDVDVDDSDPPEELPPGITTVVDVPEASEGQLEGRPRGPAASRDPDPHQGGSSNVRSKEGDVDLSPSPFLTEDPQGTPSPSDTKDKRLN